MKKINFIFAFLSFSFLVCFGMLFLFSKEKSYSEEEGRLLATKPSMAFTEWKDASQIEALEEALQDQFLYRNSFLEFQTKLEKMIGLKEKNQIYFGANETLLEKNREVIKGNIFITNLNQFYQEHNDINMSLLLLPTRITIEPELVNSYVPTSNQDQEIKQLYHQIVFNTIDVVPVLKEGSKDYPMYYRLDSHLTSYGFYYIYRKYAELNDIKPLSMNQFSIETVTDEFQGNLVKNAHTFSYKKDSIVRFVPTIEQDLTIINSRNMKVNSLYQEAALKTNSMYSYFLGTGDPIITITNSSIHTNLELLILKDESANAIIPFLVNHYDKVHVIDTNLYQESISEYLENHKKIKDVIFIYNMNELDTTISNISF